MKSNWLLAWYDWHFNGNRTKKNYLIGWTSFFFVYLVVTSHMGRQWQFLNYNLRYQFMVMSSRSCHRFAVRNHKRTEWKRGETRSILRKTHLPKQRWNFIKTVTLIHAFWPCSKFALFFSSLWKLSTEHFLLLLSR